jgi:hypothetical protein
MILNREVISKSKETTSQTKLQSCAWLSKGRASEELKNTKQQIRCHEVQQAGYINEDGWHSLHRKLQRCCERYEHAANVNELLNAYPHLCEKRKYEQPQRNSLGEIPDFIVIKVYGRKLQSAYLSRERR